MSSSDDVKALEEQLSKLALEKHDDEVSKEDVTFDRTMPCFDPLTKDPAFIEEEFNSPIALLNNNFFEDEFAKDKFESMFSRAMTWAEGAAITPEVAADVKDRLTAAIEQFNSQPNPEFERIFIRDGERSFNTPKRRVLLCHILTFLQNEVLNNDYHQGLSMIVSFLLCFLPANYVAAMIIHAQKSLLTDVWKSQSVVAATDGYVYEKLISEHYPDVHAHLRRFHVIPELYTSKYWCAFALHILPFQSLPILFDQFWCGDGVLALFRLLFLVLASQQKVILAASSVDRVLEFMSLDHKALTAAHVNRIIYNVDQEEEDEEEIAWRAKVEEIVRDLAQPDVLAAKRVEAYTVNILPRVASANKDFEKEKTPDCGRAECEDAQEHGDYFCLDCKIHLCEDCAYSRWDDHDDDEHEVRMNEDLDEED